MTISFTVNNPNLNCNFDYSSTLDDGSNLPSSITTDFTDPNNLKYVVNTNDVNDVDTFNILFLATISADNVMHEFTLKIKTEDSCAY
jgi:hypothetical protein